MTIYGQLYQEIDSSKTVIVYTRDYSFQGRVVNIEATGHLIGYVTLRTGVGATVKDTTVKGEHVVAVTA